MRRPTRRRRTCRRSSARCSRSASCARAWPQPEAAAREPIAIIGAGVRLPGGVNDLAGLWQLLRERPRRHHARSRPTAGTSTPGSTPTPTRPGKMTTRHGGFLDDVDRFDAEFFGISPREAASMDPQQRLLLETAWQALEDAGHRARQRWPAAAPASSSACANNDYGRDAASPHRETHRRATSAPATPAASPPGGCRTSSALHGPERLDRHRVLVVAGGAAPGVQSLRARRVRSGAGRRRQPDPHARDATSTSPRPA